jgi:pimeloyl-ACP methyl ester carboxylesterase
MILPVYRVGSNTSWQISFCHFLPGKLSGNLAVNWQKEFREGAEKTKSNAPLPGTCGRLTTDQKLTFDNGSLIWLIFYPLNFIFMKSFSWLMLVFLLVGGCKEEDFVPASTDAITDTQNAKIVSRVIIDGCTIETFKTGEITKICIPDNWNGELILYAHGYVSEFRPLALPDEADDYVPLFISQGYAFATTSYTENGLAIPTGIKNIVDLRKRFIKEYGEPNEIYLAGASEGGIITTLAIERYPELFSGGLSLCGPCGDFQKQINYYGDVRVLFDYFFPGVLPGDAINFPDKLISEWKSVYEPAVLQALQQDPVATAKLLATAQIPYDPANNNSIGEAVVGVLWYNVFATRDAIDKLKGQPFDNSTRVYVIPGREEESRLLNAQADRFTADKHALKNIDKYYQTTGDIAVPLVKAHTTLDPIVPFWHLPLYQQKTVAQGTSALFTGIPVSRFGHCTFTIEEIALSFGQLVQKVKAQPSAQKQARMVQPLSLVQP